MDSAITLVCDCLFGSWVLTPRAMDARRVRRHGRQLEHSRIVVGTDQVERREAQLVDDDQYGVYDLADGLVGKPAVELLDKHVGTEELDAMAGVDGGPTEGDRQVRLPSRSIYGGPKKLSHSKGCGATSLTAKRVRHAGGDSR